MTQSFFVFLTSIAMLFAPIFGLAHPVEKPVTLPDEAQPEYSEYAHFDRIDGVSDSVFYIKRPDSKTYILVSASEFGMNKNEFDSYSAFSKAIAYCRENEYTRLVIPAGNYYFRTDKQIDMSGLKNVIIDGEGANFYFSHADYFRISDCECVEIKGFSVFWNNENSRLASLVRIKNADSKNHVFDMEFTELSNVDENINISAFTLYDPETLTPGTKDGVKEKYVYTNPDIIVSREKTENNVLRITHNGELDNFADGDVFLLRHHVYDGNVFNVTNSENITFSGISIGSAAGMGWLITDRCTRFQLLDCTIGLENSDNAERISTTADALHIANTNGYFKISGCDFSFMGDDALNVHDNVCTVSELTGKNKLTLYTNAPTFKIGDKAVFCDSKYNKLDFTANVTDIDGDTVTFDTDIPDSVTVGSIVQNGSIDSANYVISNNYFHENRARGLLLQSSNGLCENNIFYKTMGNAIKVIADISPGKWLEGTGVNTLEIRNNTFSSCNVSDWGAVIDVSASINGRIADSQMLKNIYIKNNTFESCEGNILSASNANKLIFNSNSIKNTNSKIIFGKHNSNITVKNNVSDSLLGVRIRLKSLSSLF